MHAITQAKDNHDVTVARAKAAEQALLEQGKGQDVWTVWTQHCLVHCLVH